MATSISNIHDKTFSNNISLHDVYSLCNPAFTEDSFVGCHSDAYLTTVRKLSYESQFNYCEKSSDCNLLSENMDLGAGAELQRSASHHSTASGESQRSQTVRIKPRK